MSLSDAGWGAEPDAPCRGRSGVRDGVGSWADRINLRRSPSPAVIGQTWTKTCPTAKSLPGTPEDHEEIQRALGRQLVDLYRQGQDHRRHRRRQVVAQRPASRAAICRRL